MAARGPVARRGLDAREGRLWPGARRSGRGPAVGRAAVPAAGPAASAAVAPAASSPPSLPLAALVAVLLAALAAAPPASGGVASGQPGAAAGDGGRPAASLAAGLAALPRLAADEARAHLLRLDARPVAIPALDQPVGSATAKGAAPAVEALAGVVVVMLAGAGDAGDAPAAAESAARGRGAGAGTDGGARPALPALSGWAPWWEGPSAAALGDLRLVFCDPAWPPDAAAGRLAALPDVVFAEPYYLSSIAALPDDLLLGEQLNLVLVGAPAAWDLSRGELYPEVVAVVDGGMDIAHPDLAANVLLNAADPPNGADDDGNGFLDDHRGWDFATGTDDPAALRTAAPLSFQHGTHVTGLVAAVANNGRQVAGLTWNDPVLCVAAGSPTRDRAVTFGYQGLLYAAERGARVINCSWGRPLVSSLLELAVLRRVQDLGALVVAAAGNEGNAFAFYPAAYPGVLAVANVTDKGARHATSNYGLWVDLAAPGAGVLSLFPGGQVGELTGTSMASPLAAAAAALLWGREPGLSAAAVSRRLLAAALPLPGAALTAGAGLGSGLLDAGAALGWEGPGYEIVAVGVEDADGDGRVSPGEEVALRPRWLNRLAGARGPAQVTLSVPAPHDTALVVLSATATVPPLAAGASAEADRPLRVVVAADVPLGSPLPLVWSWEGAADRGRPGEPYRDRQVTELAVAPLFADLDDGEVKVTLGGNGRLGFAGKGGGNGSDGYGVRYVPAGSQMGDGLLGNLLFEGALLVGTGPGRLSDAARYAAQGAYHRDFNPPAAADAPRSLAPFALPDGRRLARVRADFTDARAAAPLPVAVRWLGLAPLAADPPGVTLLLTTILNTGTAPLAGLRYGFFLDWDLNDGGFFPAFQTNTTRFEPSGGYAVTLSGAAPAGLTVATALLPAGPEPALFRAVANDGSDPENGWGIYDGFLDEEKWDALSDPDGPREAVNTDVSQIWAGGPVDLAPGDSVRCVLLLAAGASPAEAADNLAGGRALAQRVLAAPIWETPPPAPSVGAPYPNPWNGRVSVPVAGTSLAPWRLLVYDLRGRLVRRVGPQALAGFRGELAWDGVDDAGRPAPSGTYLLRVVQDGQAATRRAVLVR